MASAPMAREPFPLATAVVLLADHAGYGMDAKEIDDVVDAVIAHDTGAIVYELGDYLTKFATQHLGYVPPVTPNPAGPVRMFAGPRTEEFTNAAAKAWLADNRGAVKKESQRFIVKKVLHNAPEVLSGLAGEPVPVGIDEERLAKIISVLRTAIPILTAVSAFVPYLIPVVIVLKMIVARYDSNHPVGSVHAVGAPGDVGLDLADL